MAVSGPSGGQSARKKFFLFEGIETIIRNGNLIRHLTYREVSSRYRGTHLGILWSLATPLLMLGVYTLVFGGIFKGRFGNGRDNSPIDFALGLFCGINLFNLFAEVVQGSPRLVLSNPNYVKKVVFPLEILSVVSVLSAFFHFIVANIPLIIGIEIAHQTFAISFLYLVPLVIPLMLGTLGLSWFLASIGVFIRDLHSAVAPMLTILMFLSAVFYSISAVPEFARRVLAINPMAQLIEITRNAVVWGIAPDWRIVFDLYGLSIAVFVFGLWVFRSCKTAFADAL